MNNCLVLNYHQIYSSAFKKRSKYCVSKEQFTSQLEFLNSVDRTSFQLTFDDGFSSDIEVVLPLLNKFGFKGLFFLPLNSEGYLKHKDAYGAALSQGHKIGAHGVSQRSLRKMFFCEQLDVFKHCKAELEETFSVEIDRFSLPYGQRNSSTLMASKVAGYKAVYGTKFGFYNSYNLGVIPRLIMKENHRVKYLKRVFSPNQFSHEFIKIRTGLKGLITENVTPEIVFRIQNSLGL